MFAVAFDGRGHDVWGIVLVVFGLVSALGIYADKAGSLGGAIDDATGWLVGVVNVLLPIIAVLIGYLLMRGARDDEGANETVGTMVGAGLAFAVLEGFCHLVGGQPDLHADASALGDAGGVIGWMIGAPLKAAASIYGAVLILSAVGLVGVLLFTGMPMAGLLDRGASVLGPLRDATARFFRSLFRIDADGDSERALLEGGTRDEFAEGGFDDATDSDEDDETADEDQEEYLEAEDYAEDDDEYEEVVVRRKKRPKQIERDELDDVAESKTAAKAKRDA